MAKRKKPAVYSCASDVLDCRLTTILLYLHTEETIPVPGEGGLVVEKRNRNVKEAKEAWEALEKAMLDGEMEAAVLNALRLGAIADRFMTQADVQLLREAEKTKARAAKGRDGKAKKKAALHKQIAGAVDKMRNKTGWSKSAAQARVADKSLSVLGKRVSLSTVVRACKSQKK